MHIHIGLAGILLLIIAVVLFSVYGWAVLVVPLLLLAAVAVLWYSLRRVSQRSERRHLQALATRRRIATLEADQGIPLLTDGACPRCGKPLLANAHYCSYCKAPTPRTALACEVCGTRNAGDAAWCGACGSPLDDAAHPDFSSPRPGTISTLVNKLLDSALER